MSFGCTAKLEPSRGIAIDKAKRPSRPERDEPEKGPAAIAAQARVLLAAAMARSSWDACLAMCMGVQTPEGASTPKMRQPSWNNTSPIEAGWSWSLRARLPRALRLALVAGLFACLITGSLAPGLAPSAEHGFDLNVHAAVYALALIVTVSLVERPFVSATVILALSGAIEIMQTFVPGRSGSWGDLAANGVGIAVALAVIGVMGALGLPVTGVKMMTEEASADPAE